MAPTPNDSARDTVTTIVVSLLSLGLPGLLILEEVTAAEVTLLN